MVDSHSNVEPLTLYTAKICPYAHRVELALEEAKINYTRYEIDLQNKPDWYAPQVNPASKVPALAAGGPTVQPDKPSPQSHKIAESLVLLEFVADLYKSLLPSNVIERAKARFFIDTVSTKFIPALFGFTWKGESAEALLKGIEAFQGLLPTHEEGKFLAGHSFTIADAALAPFLARMDVTLKNDCGVFEEGAGKKVYDILVSDPAYARYRQYLSDIKARDSFKKTFDEEYVTEAYRKRVLANRTKQPPNKY
ncbi:hypothetical protein BD779DRAFT_1529794 [Infundibulicybe gibba]|nr:hypothetical protein BD779DRAFT_1529794 [Infundibulicybe gibba]